MVKFSKQFESQLVPEWKEAFVDYWQLKRELKKIHVLSNTTTTTTANKQQQTSFPNTLFSSLRNFSLFGHQHIEHGAIHVLTLSLSLNMLFAFPLLPPPGPIQTEHIWFFFCMHEYCLLYKVNMYTSVFSGSQETRILG